MSSKILKNLTAYNFLNYSSCGWQYYHRRGITVFFIHHEPSCLIVSPNYAYITIVTFYPFPLFLHSKRPLYISLSWCMLTQFHPSNRACLSTKLTFTIEIVLHHRPHPVYRPTQNWLSVKNRWKESHSYLISTLEPSAIATNAILSCLFT